MQVFVDNIFGPELIRRQEEGTISKPFKIHAAQAVIHPRYGTEIRFNDECKFNVQLQGEPREIDRSNLKSEDIYSIDSSETADSESGHVAMLLLVEGGWFVSFDFRKYRGKSIQHLFGAYEFLIGVEFAFEKELWRLFSENMFASTELISRALVLNELGEKQVQRGSHGSTSAVVNFQSKLGNIPSEFVNLHNRYAAKRKDARYIGGEIDSENTEFKNDLSLLKKYYSFARGKFT